LIPESPVPGLKENILQAVATGAMSVFRGELSWHDTENVLLVEAMKHHGFSFWNKAENANPSRLKRG